MNKKINQAGQKIICEDILKKKFYPVWFFTNERIGNFFQKISDQLNGQKEIKKVFSIGSGGDFAFSFLSAQGLEQIEEINVCDVRQMANISIDFKIGLFKNLEYEETLKLFLGQELFYKEQIYKKIRETITLPSRKIFDFILRNCKEDNFFEMFKKLRAMV